MQPEVRAKTHQLIAGCFVQENFGMSEGMLFFVRLDDPQEVKLETCGRPICPDDEVRLVDDDGREVPDGEVGELTCRGPYTLRGYYGVPAEVMSKAQACHAGTIESAAAWFASYRAAGAEHLVIRIARPSLDGYIEAARQVLRAATARG